MTEPVSISNAIAKKTFSSNAHLPIHEFESDVNLTDLDLFTNGQPFDQFKKMREKAPIYLHAPFLNDPEPGFWSLTRYEDILKVSSNPKTFSSQAGTGTMITLGSEDRRHPKLWRSAVDHMLNLDGDLHINLRREHMPFFKPNYVADLRIKVSAKVQALLDDINPNEPCNFVTAFSQQLPIFTLSEILGIPEEDRQKLITWMEFLELAQYIQVEQMKKELEGQKTNEPVNTDMLEMFNNMIDEMFEYGRDIMNAKRKNPSDDLLSAIANAELEGQQLSPEFLDGSWLLIIFAGNDTTRNSLSGGVLALNENRDQFNKLKADHGLIKSLVPEIIRWQTPLMHMRRIATRDVELGGKLIKKGDKVVMWYVSGNRDESVIEKANEFIIDRANPRLHLSFGFGIHRCMGNRLGEMQLRIVWEEILKRYSDIEVVGEPKRVLSNFVRGIEYMPVVLHK